MKVVSDKRMKVYVEYSYLCKDKGVDLCHIFCEPGAGGVIKVFYIYNQNNIDG